MVIRGRRDMDGRTVGRKENNFKNFKLAPVARAFAFTLAAGGMIGSAHAVQPFSPAWFANKGAIQATAAATGLMPNGTPVSSLSPQGQQQAANTQLQQSIANLGQVARGIAWLQGIQASQRQTALANPSNIPDGLGAGGLDTGSLAASWQNANAPTQTTDANGKTVVDIQQTADKAIANWQTFNVGKNTIVQFDQASSDWAILNRITDPAMAPSTIEGQIRAPGTVLIVNQNGIVFTGSSQINTRNLVAAAASITDQQFTQNGIYGPDQSTPSFTNASGNLIVEEGAQIDTSAPTSATQGGGYVLLMGQQVNNAGDIETPQGQIEMAAGDNFVIRKGVGTDGNTFSTTRGNEIAPLLNPGSTSGQVINAATGLLLATEGDITLAGHDVQQNGVAVATTTVNTRGTIHLLNSASDTTGSVILGDGAITAIAIEDDGSTALDSQRSALIADSATQDALRVSAVAGLFDNLSRVTDLEDESRIEIVSGGSVNFDGGSLTLATGGQIAVSATQRTFVADGAILDVSGQVGVNLAMSSNDVVVNVQGNELRDSPDNRDSGDLFNTDITVDRRDLVEVKGGTGPGDDPDDRWYTANGLLEVSGYLDTQGHTIGEWAAQGGTIQLNGNEVVTQTGSQINLSGGSLNVATGYVAQTWLVGSDGQLYNANTAPSNMTFTGIYKGFEVAHARWGADAAEFFYNPLIAPKRILENGYTAGRDAGQLIVNAPTAVLEGDILATVYNGPLQNRVRDDLADNYLQAQTAVAKPGSVSFGRYGPGGLDGVNDTDIQIGNVADVTGGMTDNDALPADRIGATWLDATRLNAEGLGELDLGTQGNVTVDAPLTLANGGSLNIVAPIVSFNANVTAHGGSISVANILVTPGDGNSSITLDSAGAAQINVNAGVTLDTSGLWVNEMAAGGDTSDPADLSDLAWLNGGNVSLSSTQGVALAAGSVVDVSSGGAVLIGGKTQGGAGGSVTLIADAPDFSAGAVPMDAALVLGGELRAIGAIGGGTLTLGASSVLIGDAAATVPASDSGQLVLASSFFGQGFSNYDITGNNGVSVANGTQIVVTEPVYRFGATAMAAPSGTAPSAALDTWTPPLYVEDPVHDTLTPRPGASLSLHGESGSVAAGGPVVIGTGASITVDPLQSISIEAFNQITVDGALHASGGNISIVNDRPLGGGSPDFDPDGLSIWIGGDATLDVAGNAFTATDVSGRAYGVVNDGGTIVLGTDKTAPSANTGVLGSSDAFIVVRPGALLDASGASATFDAAAMLGANAGNGPLTVSSNGGTIAMTSYDGIYADGTLRALAGGTGASGGTLSVTLETPVYFTSMGSPSNALRVPRTITIDQSAQPSQLPDDLQAGVNDPSLQFGQARFSADQIEAGGFDNLLFSGRDAILFDGNVNLHAGQSISFFQGAIADTRTDAQVSISAPYVLFGGATGVKADNGFYPTLTSAGVTKVESNQQSTGTLTVDADLIDFQNDVRLGVSGSVDQLGGPAVAYDYAGFGNAEFTSQGDIRFLASQPGPIVPVGTVATTSLRTSDNLAFVAAQLYPATGANVTISAGLSGTGVSPDGVITIGRINGDDPALPDSVFGRLSMAAGTIDQGGVVRAPLGAIYLGSSGDDSSTGAHNISEAIDLLPGSITSTSAAGLVIPYGGTTDGVTYSYNGKDVSFSEADGGLNGPNGGFSVGVSLAGRSISVDQGAVIDVSGGGDLTGAGFVSGRGGSVDVLTTALANANPLNTFSASGNQVYAIVPGYAGGYAPSDGGAEGMAPGIGQRVTIPAGVPGLPAGTYTLLPARYALLPGGYRVELGKAGGDAINGAVSTGTGSYLVSGARSVANTGIASTLPSEMVLTPGAVVRDTSQYDETSYGDFAVQQATKFGQTNPVLPADGGGLGLFLTKADRADAPPALSFQGTALFQPGEGGRAGVALIDNIPFTQDDFEVVASQPTPGFVGVSLNVADVNAIGANTLEIGGWVGRGEDTQANVNSITLRSGVVLSAAEVILSARDGGITLDPGSEIDTIGRGAPSSLNGDVYDSNGFAVLAVSNNDLTFVSQEAPSAAPISIGAGAQIYSEGLISFSSGGTVAIDPTARFGTRDLGLNVGTINVGDPADMAGAVVPPGLLLSQDFLSRLLAGDTSVGAPALERLTLSATQSFNVFGSVDLSVINPATGKADLALVLNTPAIYGYGGASDVATLTVGSLTWSGIAELLPDNGSGVQQYDSLAPGGVVAGGPGTGSGVFNIVADKIVFGFADNTLPNDSVTLDRAMVGFSAVNLKAGEITANNQGTLSLYQTQGAKFGDPGTGGNLNLVTPLLTTEAGAVMGFTAGGALAMTSPAGGPSAAASGALGGEIDLHAASIDVGSTVMLPSGKLTMTADGDIVLEANARLALAGQATTLFDQTTYSWGGDVELTSANGNITQDADSVIDISAVNNTAGSVSASAVNGAALLNGQILGNTSDGFGGGGLSITGQSIGDFDALNAMLSAGGVFGSRSFDIKQGDLVIGDGVKANTVEVSVDNGSLTVNGTIDASGAAPGTIRLAAKNNLTLAGSAVLDAHGTVLQTDSYGAPIEAENRGTVELTATNGQLALNAGSTIDVSAADGSAFGQISLNAPRLIGTSTTASATGADAPANATGTDIDISAGGPINIRGAKSIAVDGFAAYKNAPNDPDTSADHPDQFITQAYLDQINQDSIDFINAALGNADLQSRLAGLKAYGTAFHLRPGVEIDSATANGDLTVSGDLNLANYRYGPNATGNGTGEPGVLTVRAGGNLNIYGSITDGFGDPAAAADDKGWTIVGGTVLTSDTPVSQSVTLGAGTSFNAAVADNEALTFDIAINATSIKAGALIPMAVTTTGDVTLTSSWTTTATIQTPGGVIAKGTVLPSGTVIPAGSMLAAGTRLPIQLSIAAMTVPKGTPLGIFTSLSLTSAVTLKAGDVIPAGTNVQIAAALNGVLPASVTLSAPLTLTTATSLPNTGISNFSFPIATNTFIKSGSTVPFAFTLATNPTTNATVVLTGGSVRDSLGNSFAEGDTIPAGTHFVGAIFTPDPAGPGIVIPAGLVANSVQFFIKNATMPAEANMSIFVSAVKFASNVTIPAGTVLPAGANIAALASPISLRTAASDGTQGKTWVNAPMLPEGAQSWSLRFVGGADIGAADTRTIMTAAALNTLGVSGDITLADSHYEVINPGVSFGGEAPSVLRTGTGDLDLITGGSFNEGSLYGIYTAGTQSAPLATDGSSNGVTGQNNPYSLPLGNEGAVATDYQAYYPTGGGNVHISAQGDMHGYTAPANVIFGFDENAAGNWLWRQGGDIAEQPTAWWINFGVFMTPQGVSNATPTTVGFTGIGTLGGGNVDIDVGGNAGGSADAIAALMRGLSPTQGLNVAVASTGRVLADGTLVQTGGGNLTVKVGGTLSNSSFTDLRGNTSIGAGAVGDVRESFGSGGTAVDPRSPDPFAVSGGSGVGGITVTPGDGVVDIAARSGIALAGVNDAGLSGLENTTPFSITANGATTTADSGGDTWFTLWTDATAINLFSAGGSVNMPARTGGTAARSFLPANLNLTAASGNLFFNGVAGAPLELTPSPQGQLNLLAADSIFGANIDISGADPSVMATPFRPGYMFGPVGAPGTVTNVSNDSYSPNTPDTLFAFGPDTPTGALHANDPNPVRIYAGGDILNLNFGEVLTFASPQAKQTTLNWYVGAKAANILAGGDIVNSGTSYAAPIALGNGESTVPGFILNLNPNDVSTMSAGGDIVYSSMQVGGPGLLEIQAGREFYAANKASLQSVGPVFNVNQSNRNSGAGITVMAGVGTAGPDYTDFAKLYFNAANQADTAIPDTDPANAGKVPVTYADQLYAWLQQRFGYTGSETDALAAFLALPSAQQGVFVRQVYFEELDASGKEFNDPASKRFQSYLRGRDTIASLFPNANAQGNAISYQGDLTLFGNSGIHTEFGGTIQTLTPGGETLVGVEGANPLGTAGVVTQGSGDIDMYSLDSILLGQSRVMTTFGGNIVAWSATGDINAGRGSKTTQVFTPPRLVYDGNGDVTLSPDVPSSGAGFATLDPIPEVPPGDMNLVAPLGTIDAGEAGIRVSGNVNLAALSVVNAANIQVQGKSTGLPVVASVNVGALTNASAAAAQATMAAQDQVHQQQAAARQALPSIFTVRVLGFGSDPADDGDTAPVSQPSGLQSKDVSYDPANPVQLIGVDQDLDPRQMARLSPDQQRQLQRGR
jgi:filamentous hemagglutinin family protein